MKTPIDQKHLPAAPGSLYRDYQMPTKASGNTLLYILVLLVIFSVLGLTMENNQQHQDIKQGADSGLGGHLIVPI